MSIYDINFTDVVWKELLPPDKRKKLMLAWGAALMKPLQWLHDLFFIEYADGFTGGIWDSIADYVKGNRVRYSDHKVYEALVDIPGLDPAPNVNSNWLLIQENWVGVRERAKYNSRKLLLEYILNKWFDTEFRQPTAFTAGTPDATAFYTPKSDIYITNTALLNNTFRAGIDEASSSFVSFTEAGAVDYVGIDYSFTGSCFTINVPLAIFNALGPNNTERENIIRQIVDKYNLAGMIYTVTTY